MKVVRQEWLESERGWGTRPDGYSLHKTEEDCDKFIRDYWNQMSLEVPDEYSRPTGQPYWWEVGKETYQKIVNSKNGIRSW